MRLLSDVRIRHFLPTDIEEVLAIYAASKLDELALEPVVPSLLPLTEDPARLAIFKRSEILVAEADRPVGYIAVLGNQITGLFVHPRARGLGIGGSLLRHALSAVTEPATLCVAASNAPAVRLYEKHGFAVLGSFVAEYNGAHVRALEMRRPLLSHERKLAQA